MKDNYQFSLNTVGFFLRFVGLYAQIPPEMSRISVSGLEAEGMKQSHVLYQSSDG